MVDTEEIIIRLCVAALLGSVVGLERQRMDWAAGLRTHMQVCVGSALIMIVSAFGFSDILGTPHVELDPSRVAAQVVSGIGFLGAGTIIFLRREVIRGLTTAAGLWTVAGIGLAVGSGLYLAAVVTTLLTFIILALLKPLEKKLFIQYRQRTINVRVSRRHISLERLQQLVEESGLKVKQIIIQQAEQAEEDNIRFVLARGSSGGPVTRIVRQLQEIEGVKEISFGTEGE